MITSHTCDSIKNHPTVNVIKTDIRVSDVVPNSSQAQSVSGSLGKYLIYVLHTGAIGT